MLDIMVANGAMALKRSEVHFHHLTCSILIEASQWLGRLSSQTATGEKTIHMFGFDYALNGLLSLLESAGATKMKDTVMLDFALHS